MRNYLIQNLIDIGLKIPQFPLKIGNFRRNSIFSHSLDNSTGIDT